jgi:hypothetical protein
MSKMYLGLHYEEDVKYIKKFVGNLQGNRPRGKPNCTWNDYVKIDLREISSEGVDWRQTKKMAVF